MAIAHHLRSAAEAELVKSSHSKTVSALDVMSDAEEALQALSSALAHNEWFFGQQRPTLFDASVFAYTHLILDDNLGWEQNPLQKLLVKHDNLVQHRDRVVKMYF